MSPTTNPTPVPTATPNTSTSTASISSAGGSLSATTGGSTVTVTAPAGAFPNGATVTLAIVSAANVPASGQRFIKSPSGQLIAFTVDAGGATLVKPLSASISNVTVPSGTTPRLAGYNNAAYDDVAGATATGTTVATNSDARFPGMTLVSHTLYVLYASATLGNGDGTVTVSGPTSAVPNGSTANFSASEATVNGFPYLGRTFTFTLDNPSAGSITPSGVFTAGATGSSGTVTATDTSLNTRTGNKAVTTSSARPANTNQTASYTGTLTETDTNNIIGPSPVSATSTSQVTNAVTAAVNGNSAVFTAAETDVAQLKTTTFNTVATVAYQPAGSSTNVRTLSTVSTDSNGVIIENDFGPNNGLVTVLPETGGSTFANGGGLTYKETDPGVNPGNVTTTNVINDDGTYTRRTYAPTTVGSGAVEDDISSQGLQLNGTYYIHELASPGTLGRAFIMDPPQSGNPPVIHYYNLTATGALGSARGQLQPGSNWLAGVTNLVSEFDSITANQALDASCSPAAAFGGNATLVMQNFTFVDVVYGTVETRTTKSYDQVGPGTVCTVVSDTVQGWYDYSEQEGNFRLFPAPSTTPVTTVQVSETLSLQNFVSATSHSRVAKSLGGGMLLPRSLVSSRVESILHQKAMKRLLSLRKAGGIR